MESVPLKTETEISNLSKQKPEDAGLPSDTVCPQPVDTALCVTTDATVQISMPTRITGEETEDTVKGIKPAEVTGKAEGVTPNEALKPELIEAPAVKTGLVCKDKDIVDVERRSEFQEMMEEFKSKPTGKETVRQISEDQQRAVSVLPSAPILDTNTTPHEDSAPVR